MHSHQLLIPGGGWWGGVWGGGGGGKSTAFLDSARISHPIPGKGLKRVLSEKQTGKLRKKMKIWTQGRMWGSEKKEVQIYEANCQTTEGDQQTAATTAG